MKASHASSWPGNFLGKRGGPFALGEAGSTLHELILKIDLYPVFEKIDHEIQVKHITIYRTFQQKAENQYNIVIGKARGDNH